LQGPAAWPRPAALMRHPTPTEAVEEQAIRDPGFPVSQRAARAEPRSPPASASPAAHAPVRPSNAGSASAKPRSRRESWPPRRTSEDKTGPPWRWQPSQGTTVRAPARPSIEGRRAAGEGCRTGARSRARKRCRPCRSAPRSGTRSAPRRSARATPARAAPHHTPDRGRRRSGAPPRTPRISQEPTRPPGCACRRMQLIREDRSNEARGRAPRLSTVGRDERQREGGAIAMDLRRQRRIRRTGAPATTPLSSAGKPLERTTAMSSSRPSRAITTCTTVVPSLTSTCAW